MLIGSTFAFAERAVLDAPLKKEYYSKGSAYKSFYQTGKIVDSYSMICDMGQAIPDAKKDNWYVNMPIEGLKLELRARAARIDAKNNIRPLGFVVVTKNGDALITFSPIGEYKDGGWEGDEFNFWSGTDTDITVYSERFGLSGYAHFDLLDGNGFFYKSSSSDNPDYFLSNCKKIRKINLPVYDWK